VRFILVFTEQNKTRKRKSLFLPVKNFSIAQSKKPWYRKLDIQFLGLYVLNTTLNIRCINVLYMILCVYIIKLGLPTVAIHKHYLL